MTKLELSEKNKTTVGITSIGGAISIVAVVILSKVGVSLDPTETAVGVSALTIIFNYFMPSNLKR